jgi:hypothetical protein
MTIEKTKTQWHKHPLMVTFAGTICAAMIGQYVSYQYQKQALENQRKYEFYKENLNGSIDTIHEISLLANQRIFATRKVLWSLEGGYTQKEIEQRYSDYYRTVEDWNIKVQVYKIKLIQYYGVGYSEFLVNNTDSINTLDDTHTPTALHSYFVRSHRITKKLYNCTLSNNCSAEQLQQDKRNSTEFIGDLTLYLESFLYQSLAQINLK